MIQTQYHVNEHTISRIRDLSQQIGIDEKIFDEPIRVKKTPHDEIFRIYGFAVKDNVYVMDSAGEYHDLQPEQANVEYVANALLQRLKSMYAKIADK